METKEFILFANILAMALCLCVNAFSSKLSTISTPTVSLWSSLCSTAYSFIKGIASKERISTVAL